MISSKKESASSNFFSSFFILFLKLQWELLLEKTVSCMQSFGPYSLDHFLTEIKSPHSLTVLFTLCGSIFPCYKPNICSSILHKCVQSYGTWPTLLLNLLFMLSIQGPSTGACEMYTKANCFASAAGKDLLTTGD